MHPIRDAILSHDLAAIESLLAEDVAFTSPNTFRPYPGKAITLAFLRAVLDVFADFRYVREIVDVGGRDLALVFKATVGDKEINGCDFIHLNAEGKIDDFMVMIRPLSAALAMERIMATRIEEIQRGFTTVTAV